MHTNSHDKKCEYLINECFYIMRGSKMCIKHKKITAINIFCGNICAHYILILINMNTY